MSALPDFHGRQGDRVERRRDQALDTLLALTVTRMGGDSPPGLAP
jgi:hypothetical protein